MASCPSCSIVSWATSLVPFASCSVQKQKFIFLFLIELYTVNLFFYIMNPLNFWCIPTWSKWKEFWLCPKIIDLSFLIFHLDTNGFSTETMLKWSLLSVRLHFYFIDKFVPFSCEQYGNGLALQCSAVVFFSSTSICSLMCNQAWHCLAFEASDLSWERSVGHN